MKWKTALIGFAGSMILLTGCGKAETSQDDAGGSSPQNIVELDKSDSENTSSRSAFPEQEGELADEQIDTVEMPEDYPREVTVKDDGYSLAIQGREGGCSEMHAELDAQGEEVIDVLMIETFPADEQVACTMDIRHPVLTVDLDDPIGDRTVALHYEERRE